MSFQQPPQRPRPQKKATRMVALTITVSLGDAAAAAEYLSSATSAEAGAGALAYHRVADALKTAVYMREQRGAL